MHYEDVVIQLSSHSAWHIKLEPTQVSFFILCLHDKLLECWEAVPLLFFSVTKINFPYFCRAAIFFLAFLAPCLFSFGTSQSWLMCDKHVTLLCYLRRLAAHKQFKHEHLSYMLKFWFSKQTQFHAKEILLFKLSLSLKFLQWSLVLFSIGMRTLIYNKHNFPLCPALK